ncbi:hypothetical protein ABZO31_26580 [Streptomyces sp. HUAS MG47]|uniref:hypothetical protein n=1 Tax=Streptomyces solicamelliae TaxID=3231716 RepID=UPI003877DDA2
MRRTLSAAVATALAGAALSLALADGTAHAHGDTLKVEITGHDFGKVRANVVWENDDDPVEGRVAASVNARSADGRTAGPWKLVREPSSASGWTTSEALPPGRWTIVVEAGYPALGRDEEEITVSPGTPASPTTAPLPTTAPTPRSTAASPATAASPTASGTKPTAAPEPRSWPWLIAGGCVLAAVAGTVTVLRARGRRAGAGR